MSLRDNSLVSLHGVESGSAGAGNAADSTTVLRPVRKPKSRDEAATRIQSFWRMLVVRRRYKREWHRRRVAREILQSEEKYVQAMETAFTTYWEPLETSANSRKPMLTKADVDAIFSRLSDILPLNRYLCDELRKRLEHWAPKSCIGDVFLRFAEHNDAAFRQTYEEYTVHYFVAIERVQQVRTTSPRFAAWLDDVQAKGSSLQSYLIMPIQRLARQHPD